MRWATRGCTLPATGIKSLCVVISVHGRAGSDAGTLCTGCLVAMPACCGVDLLCGSTAAKNERAEPADRPSAASPSSLGGWYWGRRSQLLLLGKLGRFRPRSPGSNPLRLTPHPASPHATHNPRPAGCLCTPSRACSSCCGSCTRRRKARRISTNSTSGRCWLRCDSLSVNSPPTRHPGLPPWCLGTVWA